MTTLPGGGPPSLAGRASGAARDLGQQLKGALGGAKVGDVQADVGADHAHQRHRRQVEALRHHLRADQHVGLALQEGGEDLLVRVACRCVTSRSQRSVRACREAARAPPPRPRSTPRPIGRRRAPPHIGQRSKQARGAVALVAEQPLDLAAVGAKCLW